MRICELVRGVNPKLIRGTMGHRRYQGHLRNRATVEYREMLATEIVPCHECGERATIPDHHPPVSSFPHPSMWEGILLPHCKRCSSRQGAKQRWARSRKPINTREW